MFCDESMCRFSEIPVSLKKFLKMRPVELLIAKLSQKIRFDIKQEKNLEEFKT